MLDIKYIRENLEEAEKRLATRGEAIDLKKVKSLDTERRRLLQEVEALRQRRNAVSEEVGRLKKEKKDAGELVSEMQEVSLNIKALDQEVTTCEEELKEFLLNIPNLPHPSVPVGKDETENPVVRTFGEKPEFRHGFPL
jgi:seryl-tRNA synthetase